jgi:hypothetical protein
MRLSAARKRLSIGIFESKLASETTRDRQFAQFELSMHFLSDGFSQRTYIALLCYSVANSSS